MLIVYFFIGLIALAAVIYLVNKVKLEKKNKTLNEDTDEREEKL